MKKIVDVQNKSDSRHISINKVGITNSCFQGQVQYGEENITVIGKINCFVSLCENQKGTHMSRMSRAISNYHNSLINFNSLKVLTTDLKEWLGTKDIYITFDLDLIRKKKSPVTEYEGYEGFKLIIENIIENDIFTSKCRVEFIGTSLCPASKTNSEYGAHNQRSLVTITFPYLENTDIKKYLEIGEESLSSPVYPIIKLDDEKYITEKAYENAKFVEDIVRDIVVNINKANLSFKTITCENFESIHTHNAYALISNE